MTRLDQLATPTRRNGEHIRAVIERERQQQIDAMLESNALDNSTASRNKSRSMIHLASTGSHGGIRKQLGGSRTLRKSNTTKSMTQLVTAKLTNTKSNNLPTATLARNRKFKDSDIDSTTTNVSTAGVFVYCVHQKKKTKLYYSSLNFAACFLFVCGKTSKRGSY